MKKIILSRVQLRKLIFSCVFIAIIVAGIILNALGLTNKVIYIALGIPFVICILGIIIG